LKENGFFAFNAQDPVSIRLVGIKQQIRGAHCLLAQLAEKICLLNFEEEI